MIFLAFSGVLWYNTYIKRKGERAWDRTFSRVFPPEFQAAFLSMKAELSSLRTELHALTECTGAAEKTTREKVVHDVPDEERFDKEGNPLEYLGEDHIRYTLVVTSKEYSIQDIRVKSYGAKCGKGTDGSRSEVKQGDAPSAIIPHSPADASVLADVLVIKCDYAIPLFRQEHMMRDSGIPIHRNTLAFWIIAIATLVKPLWDALREELLRMDVIHADETFLQVLKNVIGNPRA